MHDIIVSAEAFTGDISTALQILVYEHVQDDTNFARDLELETVNSISAMPLLIAP